MLLCFPLLLSMGGCGETFTIPKADANFLALYAANETAEKALYDAYELKDRTLKYISAGDYACGTPGDSILSELRNASADKFFKGTSVRNIQAELAFLDTYTKQLNLIVVQTKITQSDIDVFTAAAHSLSGTIPYAATAEGAGKLAKAVAALVSFQRARQVAIGYAGKLNEVIGSLENNLLLPEKRYAALYSAWNECALDMLFYVREVNVHCKARGSLSESHLSATGLCPRAKPSISMRLITP